MLSNIIGGILVMVIAISLMGPITDEVNLASANVTGWGATSLKFVPFAFALAISVIGIATAYFGLKNAGLFGDEGEEGDESEEGEDYGEEEEEYEAEEEVVENKPAKPKIKPNPKIEKEYKPVDSKYFEKKSDFEKKSEFD